MTGQRKVHGSDTPVPTDEWRSMAVLVGSNKRHTPMECSQTIAMPRRQEARYRFYLPDALRKVVRRRCMTRSLGFIFTADAPPRVHNLTARHTCACNIEIRRRIVSGLIGLGRWVGQTFVCRYETRPCIFCSTAMEAARACPVRNGGVDGCYCQGWVAVFAQHLLECQ